MLRITDQYFWNFVFAVFYVVLIALSAIILDTEARVAYQDLTVFEFFLITLATWRLIQLFVFDHCSKWLREQFFDVKKVGKGYTLEKPKTGPCRTIADILSSAWLAGLWLAPLVTFWFLLTTYSYYVVLFLAVAAVASLLQTVATVATALAEQRS